MAALSQGVKTVAVLGGGVTGLSAAYALSQSLPSAHYRIVVLEAQERLGGYMHSVRVPVQGAPGRDAPTALLEWGPRSLMPGKYKGLRMIELVRCFANTSWTNLG